MTQIDTVAAAPPATLALNEAEQRQTGQIADRLARTEPGLTDDPKWLAAVRDASAELPTRLLVELRRFRHDAGPDATLLIRDLPVSPPGGSNALPPTPTRPGSVERTATTAAAVITLAMLQLGEVLAYRNEKTGALVQNVVPVPGQKTQQSNAGSVLLEMHNENAFHPNRPDYVGLLCVREDPGGQARLRTASVRRALPLLSAQARQVLSEERFLTEAPPSFGVVEDAAPAHAILLGSRQDPGILVDFSATHPLDEEAREAMAELRDVLTRTASALPLRPGDLAIVDNRLAVHGRTSFTPRYDGTDRWLHRVYASLDHRRSRPVRRDGGSVLD
ncbi:MULTISPECIES: TauD/TfdA family dioxygenase [Streptomyces]|uniref:Clavaminate synthase n=2 Tax=Streptomyces TaxID=1883 RepID=A0A3R7HH17_9ACTN|nr:MULTISPECIES: TauD/TfdA family dioxygenase [Streptomyces]KNE81964.1 clavaminate synthase [Streptomyces fradiae]OFA51553.1 clavaminate synthase [Streptomyces fradiae]PQM20739.1 clavaminate synthase [Streptomyces xinghaiensis]RKM95942.1 clavaminate synthase [Streptomyces xinghaiensis]RNC70923.1 clavaminate synthase [Streptomyces xinghaiensis]